MKSIASLMTNLANLKRLHIAKYDEDPRFVVVNQFTAQQLANEAQTVNSIKQEGNTVTIDGLAVVVYTQDHTRNIVMEVA